MILVATCSATAPSLPELLLASVIPARRALP
jgi:hypothetical protein